ncbi:hypothetical protein HCN44_004657 [Aphidius gifuensis]|uniref:C2H2-type domain-containing protein n=1 Tax=Aphidius gifuensis TaxID=684658 RepID=A0A834XZZ8_APHGI|nr:hypothetical protein HCN44_004657 [Aphidius gifuensis]
MCNKSETSSNKILWCPWKDKNSNEEKKNISVDCDTTEDNASILSSSSSSSDSERQTLSPCSTSSSEYPRQSKKHKNINNLLNDSNKKLLDQSELVSNQSNQYQFNDHKSAFTSTYSYPMHHDFFSTWLRLNEVHIPEQCYTNGLINSVTNLPFDGSVQHAAQRIHEEDIAAKRLKKLRPKKFQCQYCVAAFSNNGQLRGHVRIHTGERPYKCDAENCGKSFTRNEELTRHKRIHTGLRPHSCDMCGKKFGRKDHLKKHTRTHENRSFYHIPMINPMIMGHHQIAAQLYPMPPHPNAYQIC